MISHKKLVAAIVCAAALAGCDSIKSTDEAPSIDRPAATVVLGGTVTGLSATRPVVLSVALTNNGLNNGVTEYSVRGTEVLRFGSVNVGAGYDVTIIRQPTGRSCTIANGSGTATATVDDITVTCVRDDTDLFTLTAGIATELSTAPPQGFAITLTTEEGSETIVPTAGQTSVTFTLPIFYPPSTSPPTFNYAVTATNTVGGKTNRCLVNGGTGSLVDNDATTPANITTGITVASCLYTISAVAQYSTPLGGTAQAMGAGGLQLGLRSQLTDEIVVQAPLINAFSGTAVAFPGTFAANSDALYEVVVQDHPDGQYCIVNGGGLAQLVTANANVTVQVRCRNLPAQANQLKGVYQRDTPAIRETAQGDNPVGSEIPAPRIQTRDFLAFFPNGTFLHGTHRATATAGVEHGFYDYNPGAATINFSIWTDTNGSASTTNNAGNISLTQAGCGFNYSVTFPGSVGAPCAPSATVSFGPVQSFNACGNTCTITAPAYADVMRANAPTGGLSGVAVTTPVRLPFNPNAFPVAFTSGVAPLTATEVEWTPGSPGVPGTLSMRFGGFASPINLNPVWTLTEPVNTEGQIQGSWTSADSKRVFVYNNVTYYGFHAGVNGAPNLQDACFTILDVRVAQGYYTRRGGDTGCMGTADAALGTTNVGTVDVPNATTTNTTQPLIPGFIGRLPGSRSNAVASPSPVRFTVTAGAPDTLTIQNTLNDNPIDPPVVFTRTTSY